MQKLIVISLIFYLVSLAVNAQTPVFTWMWGIDSIASFKGGTYGGTIHLMENEHGWPVVK